MYLQLQSDVLGKLDRWRGTWGGMALGLFLVMNVACNDPQSDGPQSSGQAASDPTDGSLTMSIGGQTAKNPDAEVFQPDASTVPTPDGRISLDATTADGGHMPDGVPDAALMIDSGPIAEDAVVSDMMMDSAMPPPPPEVHPNTLVQDSLFQCGDAVQASPARIRRLNRMEWLRNIGQNRASAAARNPLVPHESLRYPTYSEGVSLDTATVDQFMDINDLPGGSWTTRFGSPRLDLVINNHPELRCFQSPCVPSQCAEGFACSNGRCQEGSCGEFGCPNPYRCENDACVFDETLLPDDECVVQFVTFLLENGVYFRPAKEHEVAQLVDFAKTKMRQEGPQGSDRNQTIIQVVQAAWMTSGALFRSETGGPEDDSGRRPLDAFELALALSYALSDRAPGAPIYVYPFSTPEGFLPEIASAAADGSILQPETIARLVRTYAGGIDSGTLGPDEDPDELPPEILALDTPDTRGEYARAIAQRGGRLDLRQDYSEPRRSRRGEFYLSDKLAGFFRAWLGYAEAETVFKDRPEATSRFDDGNTSIYRPALSAWNNALSGYYGHEPTLIQLMDDTIARVVIEDVDVLRNLLTTRLFYLPSSVSNPHGGAPVSGYLYDIDTEAMPIMDNRAARWTLLPADQRAGVLTHPAWLAAHGGNFENDPSAIHRGKWIRENLLCGLVPDVPITVDAQLDPETVHESARTRVAAKTEAPECIGCHSLMNPLGYPFEIYNHAGYVREEDHGVEPNGRSQLVLMPEGQLDTHVTDAVEMMSLLAESRHVKRCFIRQNFRYFMGRDETVNDGCTLAAMEQSYDDSGGSMIEMLTTLMTSDAFRYRRVVEEENAP